LIFNTERTARFVGPPRANGPVNVTVPGPSKAPPVQVAASLTLRLFVAVTVPEEKDKPCRVIFWLSVTVEVVMEAIQSRLS
jgi:hypothetical protein